MKNIKQNYEHWLYIVPFALIWLFLIKVFGATTLKDQVMRIPDSGGYTVVFYFLFSKFLWKWPIFQKWFVPYPNLQGTWQGYLHSTWKNPETKKRIDPIPVQFCIKQDFENLYIAMFTKESASYSQAAQFITETDGSQCIKYIYTNKPKQTVRERSEIHEGTAELRIIHKSQIELHGGYWTSRETTGEIELKKVSDQLTNCFNP